MLRIQFVQGGKSITGYRSGQRQGSNLASVEYAPVVKHRCEFGYCNAVVSLVFTMVIMRTELYLTATA